MIRDCVCPRAKHQHGTEQAYISDMCRCDACRKAHADKARWRTRQKAYGKELSGLAPAAGSALRLEALATLGWSFAVIGERLGMDAMVMLRVRRQPNILRAKADAIAAVYDELWDTHAPTTTRAERISAVRTVRFAERHGFLPPMALDDDLLDTPGYRPVMPTGGGWELQPCGTDAAARRHYRLGEPMDEACRRAMGRTGAAYRARKRAAA